jgi:YhcH/YjgK/YiaL family protein
MLTSILRLFCRLCKNDPSRWNAQRTDKWFEEGKWLNGWAVKPDASINRKQFAISYYRNRERWDKAFTFLRENDLSRLEAKRYDLDGDNLFVMINEYTTKNSGEVDFEAHIKYIDIQHIVQGSELIGLAPLSSQVSIIQDFNSTKDIGFYSFKTTKMHLADPSGFFIFFPDDAHKPGVSVNENTLVRKVVIKVKIVSDFKG